MAPPFGSCNSSSNYAASILNQCGGIPGADRNLISVDGEIAVPIGQEVKFRKMIDIEPHEFARRLSVPKIYKIAAMKPGNGIRSDPASVKAPHDRFRWISKRNAPLGPSGKRVPQVNAAVVYRRKFLPVRT